MKPMVLVVWDDAEDPADGKTWLDEEDVEKFSANDCEVRSVGYIESYTQKYLTLSGDIIPGLGHRGRVTKIPRGMIRSITSLGEGEPYAE